MEVKIKVKGITKRWIINVMMLLAAVVLVLVITLGVTVSNYYYSALERSLDSYGSSFEKLSVYDSAEFEKAARSLIQQFPLKNKMEVQVIDSSGRVIASTGGFLPEGSTDMPDYDLALKNGRNSVNWTGKSDTGERIMASTYILTDYGNGSNGAVRCLVSTHKVDRQIIFIIGIIAAVGLAVIAFAAISSVYFANSIIKPVREVGNIARRIALGDFKARIDVKENNEIGELCDTINYMAHELGETEDMKNEFISSISHELRTPLTAIKGWGETVKDAIGNDTQLVKKGVDIIIGESGRLSGLVEELLDFSRMQSGRMSFRNEKIDILAELGEAVFIYQDVAKRAGILLAYDEPNVISTVIGDADRLEQVFINVIDNAIKYTGSGGTVNVTASVEEGCVRIVISDTGVGIPAADLDKVKEKFYKANKTVRGSGIGLAVADEIIKHHNGLLLIDSKEGVGTTVTIVLPTDTPHDTSSGRTDSADAVNVIPAAGETEESNEQTEQ